MMFLFHGVLWTLSRVLNKFHEAEEEVIFTGTSKYCLDGVAFDPPVYIQRQEAVYRILNDFCVTLHIKKIVDFGCGGLEYFKVFKNLNGVQEVLEIDVNTDLLEKLYTILLPTAGDYMSNRKCELNVKVLAGSISQVDSRLLGTDAVVCVEVIEHLYPDTLEKVPWTVFGFIKPVLAIFTTPNRDFNILFELKTPFRDDDHKFEWSRQQFKCWAYNIVKRYPDYTVNFYGIAKGPEGAESVGCCTQMAVFVRKNSLVSESSPEYLSMKEELMIYKCIGEYTYPACTRFENEDHCVISKIEQILCNLGQSDDEQSSDFSVPLSFLHSKLASNTTSVTELQHILEDAKWKVKNCSGELHVFPFCEGYDTDSQSETGSCGSEELLDDNIGTQNYIQDNETSWDDCCQNFDMWDI